MNLWVVFLTGLTTGGLTCVAVQGGLLASVVASREEDLPEKSQHTLLPIFSFISAKLISHIILGFALGLFGSVIQLSFIWRVFFQTLAALYMLATAANLLNLHPIFRYVVLQPPRFIRRYLRSVSKGNPIRQAQGKDVFTPALLGFLTILIPCGTTLAMEVLAISSGSPFVGGAIMATFVLGTMPFFFIVGYSTLKLGDVFRQRFFTVAAILVFILGVWSLNGVLNLVGSSVTLETVWNEIVSTVTIRPNENQTNRLEGTKQEFTINVGSRGYMPSVVNVEKGKPVVLSLITNNNYSCTSSFIIPKLGIVKQLPATGVTTIDFTPVETGTMRWTCGMGMFGGTINVI